MLYRLDDVDPNGAPGRENRRHLHGNQGNTEFAHELQRNINARLRGLLRSLWARLRGVSPSALALRDALPFRMRDIFLIQHGSGMPLAHSPPGSEQVADSDLISAMLTAIRDLGRDAFNNQDELDEIQYGGARVIIQSGKSAYLAVVIDGVGPEGFHAFIHQLLADLHVRYENVLRDYDGNPENLPNLQPWLAQLVVDVEGGPNATPRPLTAQQRLALLGGVDWALVEWVGENGVEQVWVRLHWISLLSPLPTSVITPRPVHSWTAFPT